MYGFFENDDLRPELPRGGVRPIRFVPKLNGSAVDFTGLSSATWEAKKKGGETLEVGTTAPTSASFGDRTVGFYTIQLAAINSILEDCILTVDWAFGGLSYRETVMFDVCLIPLGEQIGVSDLTEARFDASTHLIRLGGLNGNTGEQTQMEAGTRIVATRARSDLQQKLRRKAFNDGQIRPYQILDQRAVRRIEVLMALRELYKSMANAPTNGEDQASSLYRFYAAEAEREFQQLVVTYSDQEEVQVASIEEHSNCYYVRRVRA